MKQRRLCCSIRCRWGTALEWASVTLCSSSCSPDLITSLNTQTLSCRWLRLWMWLSRDTTRPSSFWDIPQKINAPVQCTSHTFTSTVISFQCLSCLLASLHQINHIYSRTVDFLEPVWLCTSHEDEQQHSFSFPVLSSPSPAFPHLSDSGIVTVAAVPGGRQCLVMDCIETGVMLC